MEPTQAINLIESVLRNVVRAVLGNAWQQSKGIDLSKLKQKHAEDQQRRCGALVSDDLLNYIEFYELKEIITGQWPAFEPALQKKKYFDLYMSRLEAFRNPAMHSRMLLPFEQNLVLGIVGELQNQVTIWRSQKGPDMNYYPKIDLITESFGRTYPPTPPPEPLRVDVGDTVTFDCEATDPQGRPLTWQLLPNNQIEFGESKSGSSVRLSWTVDEAHVSDYMFVLIRMKHDGQFHAMNFSYDDEASFIFAVSPPH